MTLKRNLTLRYLSVLILLAILLAIGASTFTVYFQDMKSDGRLINVSGRQRMLSQKIVRLNFEKMIEKNSFKYKENKRQLIEAIDLMEKSHQTLIREGEDNSIYKNIYFEGNPSLDQRVTEFISAFRSFAYERQGVFPSEKIEILLKELDRAVAVFESENKKHGKSLVAIQAVSFILALLVLSFSGYFVFRPMTFEVVEKTERLSMANYFLLKERDHSKFLSEISAIANNARTFNSVLNQVLEKICKHAKWSVGHAYITDTADPNNLVPTKIWYVDHPSRFAQFQETTEKTTFKKGIGLPGRVLESSTAAWIDDVAKDSNFPRNKLTTHINVHSAFGLPILVQGQVVAVLEFFSEKVIVRNDQLLSTVAHISHQLGQVFEREKSKTEIKKLNQALENQIEERTRVIIEQQAKIQASSKMSALGEMASGIAHEINTPLASIAVLSSQFQELIDDDPIDKILLKSHANQIELTMARIGKIIKGLRSFSRDASADPFVLMNAKELIDDVFSLCKERYSASGVVLSVSMSSLNVTFFGRPAELAQVLVNLLNNSFEAISSLDEKWIKVDVADLGQVVEFRITDSGNGIPISIQEKMFQPFFTTKEIGKGTGIGLSISRNILKAHGGELSLSPSEKNTQFILRILKNYQPANNNERNEEVA